MLFPTGVELHNGKIRISFTYRGIRCREVLKGWTASNSNIKKAGNLRAVIVSEIQLGEFDYALRFPESGSVKKFTSARVARSWGELVDLWVDAKEEEVSKNTMARMKAQIKSIAIIIGERTPIDKITHSDMMQYRKKLLRGRHFIRKEVNEIELAGALTPSMTISRWSARFCGLFTVANLYVLSPSSTSPSYTRPVLNRIRYCGMNMPQ